MPSQQMSFLSGDKPLTAYYVRPEGIGPFPGVVVIHEIFGLTENIKNIVSANGCTGISLSERRGASQLCNEYKYLEPETCSYQPFSGVLKIHTICELAKVGCTPREVSIILDYTLALSVMRNATEAEVNDVFDRINTYGRRLSDQERRQSGVQNDFSNMVREIACTLRGDQSADILPLKLMPSISTDLPMMKHGYEVQANEVFWVNQGT